VRTEHTHTENKQAVIRLKPLGESLQSVVLVAHGYWAAMDSGTSASHGAVFKNRRTTLRSLGLKHVITACFDTVSIIDSGVLEFDTENCRIERAKIFDMCRWAE